MRDILKQIKEDTRVEEELIGLIYSGYDEFIEDQIDRWSYEDWDDTGVDEADLLDEYNPYSRKSDKANRRQGISSPNPEDVYTEFKCYIADSEELYNYLEETFGELTTYEENLIIVKYILRDDEGILASIDKEISNSSYMAY